jgi:hypothetical protein
MRLDWPPIIGRAGEIAGSALMTLRQCFYILVMEGAIPNVDSSYKTLSRLTAAARRDGWFPSFLDGTREVFRFRTWNGLEDAIGDTADSYRRDRTEGQPCQVWIAGEKRTLARQLQDWFGDLGCPIVVCAGYPSQTLCDDVREAIEADGRESVLVYAGDFDPSGEDIARDFVERVDAFDEFVRVAVNAEQIDALGLPPMPGKTTDARAAAFVARHGQLMQVEVEAVHPETLRRLYQAAIDTVWDSSTFDNVLACEDDERRALYALLNRVEGDEPDDDGGP